MRHVPASRTCIIRDTDYLRRRTPAAATTAKEEQEGQEQESEAIVAHYHRLPRQFCAGFRLLPAPVMDRTPARASRPWSSSSGSPTCSVSSSDSGSTITNGPTTTNRRLVNGGGSGQVRRWAIVDAVNGYGGEPEEAVPTVHRIPNVDPVVLRELSTRTRAASLGCNGEQNILPSSLNDTIWPASPKAPPSTPESRSPTRSPVQRGSPATGNGVVRGYDRGAEGGAASSLSPELVDMAEMAAYDVVRETIRRLNEEVRKPDPLA